jgi:ABC-type Co2+ transport system permease subunit
MISKLLAAVAIAIAIIAQALMFAAEWIGDLSDEWNSDA